MADAPTPEEIADPREAAALRDIITSGSLIACYTKCWPCLFGEHPDPPRWHTWAEADDVEYAAALGRPDPSQSRCGCDCAKVDGEGRLGG